MAAQDGMVDARVSEHYNLKERLGKGAYGIVWKATTRESNDTVALKKVFDAFRNATDAQRTFREIMYLQAFRDHPNIVSLLNVIKASNNLDLYLVFEHMDLDLNRAIESKILQEEHRKYVTFQIAHGLAYLHSGDVIHRDLKPDNVLLNEACDVKIADFGLARSTHTGLDQGSTSLMTEYVATRWFRSPEMLLGSKKYTKASDIWSLGCIIGQMYRGKPLFMGSSTLHQVDVILQTIGTPSQSEVLELCAPYAQQAMPARSRGIRMPVADLMPLVPAEGLDLVSRLLQFSPKKRLSIEQILTHAFIADFYNESAILRKQRPVKLSIDDKLKHTVDFYRSQLYEEIERGPEPEPDDVHEHASSSSHASTHTTFREQCSDNTINDELAAPQMGQQPASAHGCQQSTRMGQQSTRVPSQSVGLGQHSAHVGPHSARGSQQQRPSMARPSSNVPQMLANTSASTQRDSMTPSERASHRRNASSIFGDNVSWLVLFLILYLVADPGQQSRLSELQAKGNPISGRQHTAPRSSRGQAPSLSISGRSEPAWNGFGVGRR